MRPLNLWYHASFHRLVGSIFLLSMQKAVSSIICFRLWVAISSCFCFSLPASFWVGLPEKRDDRSWAGCFSPLSCCYPRSCCEWRFQTACWICLAPFSSGWNTEQYQLLPWHAAFSQSVPTYKDWLVALLTFSGNGSPCEDLHWCNTRWQSAYCRSYPVHFVELLHEVHVVGLLEFELHLELHDGLGEVWRELHFLLRKVGRSWLCLFVFEEAEHVELLFKSSDYRFESNRNWVVEAKL